MANYITISGVAILELLRDDYTDIPPEAIAISDAEGELLRRCSNFGDYQYVDGAVVAVAGAAEKRALQAQIETLERAQLMPRLTREVTLVLMASTAAGQGVDEPALYAANIGYKKLKDFEAQIVALRDQMAAL